MSIDQFVRRILDEAQDWLPNRLEAAITECRAIGEADLADQLQEILDRTNDEIEQADVDFEKVMAEQRVEQFANALIEALAVDLAGQVLTMRRERAEQIELRRLAAMPPHQIRAELVAMSRTDNARYCRTRQALAGHVPPSVFR